MLSTEVCLLVGSASQRALKDQSIAINVMTDISQEIHLIDSRTENAHNFDYSGEIGDS